MTKPLRVVLIVGNFPGDGKPLLPLADRLDLIVYGTGRRQPWLTYTPEPPAGCRTRSFEPILSTTRSGHLLWLYRGLWRALDADQPDVVHVVSEPWGMLSLQAAMWARRNPNAALVLHGCDRIWWHGSPAERLARRLLAQYALSRADGYAAESAKAVQLAVQGGLARGTPTSVIHTNPRDPDVFRPARASERLACRRQLGLPDRGLGIGFLGVFVPEKGPFVFFDALRQIDRGLLESSWVAVAGTGPMEREVAARAAEERAFFLGCLSYPHQVADFYRSIDVFVLPSFRTADKEEQGPRAIIEAMLSSCVVVGTNCGAIPEMVDGVGIVVRQKDPSDLARGIVKGIASATSTSERREARHKAIAVYSGEAVAGQLVELWHGSRVRASAGRSAAAARSLAVETPEC